MEAQVTRGRSKAIGLSNFNKQQIERIFNSSDIKPACVQIEMHVAMQQKELSRYCQEKGIVVIAYSPLGSPGINTFLEQCGQTAKSLPNMMHHPTIIKIAQKYKKSNGQVMIRFLIQKSVVPIPKSTNHLRLKENIQVFNFTLDNNDMEEIEKLDQGESARICDFKFFPGLQEHPEWPF